MFTPFKCGVYEALAIIEDNEDLEPEKNYIEPPDPAIASDEDSGEEDAGALINNLSGRQLNAPCEVVLHQSSRPRRSCRNKNTESSQDTRKPRSQDKLRGHSNSDSRGSIRSPVVDGAEDEAEAEAQDAAIIVIREKVHHHPPIICDSIKVRWSKPPSHPFSEATKMCVRELPGLVEIGML